MTFVSVLPKITPFGFGSLPLDDGNFASLQCMVSVGDLPLEIKWLYPKMSTPNHGVTLTKIAPQVSILTIPRVSSKNIGNYTCIATNSAGRDIYTTSLYVNGLTSN